MLIEVIPRFLNVHTSSERYSVAGGEMFVIVLWLFRFEKFCDAVKCMKLTAPIHTTLGPDASVGLNFEGGWENIV